MGAPSKRARKTRVATDFDAARIARSLAAPTDSNSVYSWTLANIFDARNQQMRGNFALPSQLAASMRTDDACFVARSNRLAPQRCISVEIVPAKGTLGAKVASEAEAIYGQQGVGITPGTLADINGCLVDHGVAFAINVTTPRSDGSRTDIEVRYWPIEHVRWDSYKRCFMTRVDIMSDAEAEGATMSEVPIVHGDGRWIIFSSHDHEPFRQDAAVLAAALVWARHAFGNRDWAKSSVAHGSAKVIGSLPEGMALQKADGSLTAEAQALLDLLRSYASSDAPAGIKPAGAEVTFVSDTSTAWQVFSELVLNAEKAAARIYLGTDGVLGSQGGAPGVDVATLLGVALTKIQGDLGAITRGLQTGSIEIWTALNFGDSTLAPTRRYQIPDADADADRESYAKRKAAFHADIDAAKKNGFEVDQAYVDAVAEKHGVEAPLLPKATDAKAPTIALAPTDLARVVSVNEARASAGLGALTGVDGAPDPDGLLTVEQFAAKKAADVAAPTATPPLATEVVGALHHLATAVGGLEVAKGKDGRDGRDGVNGKDGRHGVDGKVGRPGIQGLTGPRGSSGPRGPKGLDGEEVRLTFAQQNAAFLEDVRLTKTLTGKVSGKTFARLAKAHGVDPSIYED